MLSWYCSATAGRPLKHRYIILGLQLKLQAIGRMSTVSCILWTPPTITSILYHSPDLLRV